MTGVSIIHIRQLPSTRRVIPTVTQRAVERETDRRSVLPVPLTPAIQTFLRVPTGRNPTADLEKAVKEVLASLQLMHSVIMPFLIATHMAAVIAIVNPITSTMMRFFLGLNTPVLRERCIITTVKQKNPSGRNQGNGWKEREERKRERKRKNGTFLESKMEETLASTSTESSMLLQSQANTYLLQRVLTEIITAALKNEKVAMVIILNLGMCPLITEKICKDLVKVTEKDRWSKLVQCIPQLFPLWCIGLSLLPQMLEGKQWFPQQEVYKMFHHQPHHLHDPTSMTTLPIPHHQM